MTTDKSVPTKEQLEVGLNALLQANRHARNKGAALVEWLSLFGVNGRVSHITEDRQCGNRVSEQFRYKPDVVIFLCDDVVKEASLLNYIHRNIYSSIRAVLVVANRKPFAYLKLYVGKYMNNFAQWCIANLSLNAEPLFQGVSTEMPIDSRQIIYYGAPGTGKSDGIERKLREKQIEPIRTTFHPDSDYQSFVGAYKPFMKKIQRVVYVNDGKTAQLVTGPEELKDEEVISYEFRPQSFTEAYVKAWEAMVAGETRPVVLVIEEINRGDCAKIFGDLFQLLDRDDKTGFSRYPIVADRDLRDYLEKTFGTPAFQACASVEGIDAGVWNDVKVGKKLVLPPNLYIWATMNTSDQSLFPMDSAFKRRWEWKYVPIKNHKDEGWTIDVSGSKKYDWWDFLEKVNKHIFDLTNSEDKQLGYFFVKAKDKVVTLDVFVNKVVFYLWNAVFKDCYTECDFLKDGSGYLIFTKFFDDEGNAKADVVQKFLDTLKVDPPKVNENVGTPGGTPQTSSGGQPAVDGESQQSDATVGNEEVQG